MSGIIVNGVQYEHCMQCTEFVEISTLLYEFSPRFPQYDKVDVCPLCSYKNKQRKRRAKLLRGREAE